MSRRKVTKPHEHGCGHGHGAGTGHHVHNHHNHNHHGHHHHSGHTAPVSTPNLHPRTPITPAFPLPLPSPNEKQSSPRLFANDPPISKLQSLMGRRTSIGGLSGFNPLDLSTPSAGFTQRHFPPEREFDYPSSAVHVVPQELPASAFTVTPPSQSASQTQADSLPQAQAQADVHQQAQTGVQSQRQPSSSRSVASEKLTVDISDSENNV